MHERDSLMIYNHEEKSHLTQGTKNVDFKACREDLLKWSFGHPAICRPDEDRVLLAHYAGAPARMSIYFVRITLSKREPTTPTPPKGGPGRD